MKKPSILICLYAYFPFANANTNVMLPLINRLAEDFEVHILTGNVNNTAPKQEIMENGIVVHRYNSVGGFKRMLHIFGDMDIGKKRSLLKSIVVKICARASRLLQKLSYFQKPEYMLLKKIVKQEPISLVISTCECFSSHRNMLRLKKETDFKTPWIAYFMDPYAYFIKNRGVEGELLETERQVYEKSDLILTTEEIFEENKSNAFAPYLYKTKPFKFGNFKTCDNKLINPIFDENKINCVFVGSLLNRSIRDPHYLYKIINEATDDFQFHMICNNLSAENISQAESGITAKHRVKWYKNLPLEECMGIISNADILINLGNKSLNQTPSKVFDYIGTGRPVVNFYSLENDTSKRYLEKYPNKLNIFEADDQILQNAKGFVEFASGKKGVRLSKDEIEEIYKEYKSEKVTEETATLIKSFLTKEVSPNK